MDIYLATALLGLSMGAGAIATAWALHEASLRRAVRDGYSITYGVTGRPADLAAQQRDLADRHELARKVGSRHNVVAFPGRAKRGA